MSEKFLVIGDSSFYGSNFIEYVQDHTADEAGGISLRDHKQRLELRKAEYVINFAAMNIVEDSWKHPLNYCRINIMDHLAILTALLRSERLKKYIHVST